MLAALVHVGIAKVRLTQMKPAIETNSDDRSPWMEYGLALWLSSRASS
jgi:hypothetical protein